jgi:uncharacterized membrane protein
MNLARTLRAFRGRPALSAAVLIALCVSGAGVLFVRPSQAVLVGWCAAASVYLLLAWRTARQATVARMRERAATLDAGSGVIVAVAIGAAAASVAAIVLDLGHARGGGHGPELLLSGLTLVLSWFFVHTVFAFHYAHLFYVEPRHLSFPGGGEPTFADFMYFSLVVGMTAQVSDVVTGTAAMRRLVMVHGVIAFFFNTAILALGVNLAAGLVG